MEEQKQALRCKRTNKLLARKDSKGIYLICKECKQEEFFSWSELEEKSEEVKLAQ